MCFTVSDCVFWAQQRNGVCGRLRNRFEGNGVVIHAMRTSFCVCLAPRSLSLRMSGETTPKIKVSEAVAASMAIPIIFSPQEF